MAHESIRKRKECRCAGGVHFLTIITHKNAYLNPAKKSKTILGTKHGRYLYAECVIRKYKLPQPVRCMHTLAHTHTLTHSHTHIFTHTHTQICTQMEKMNNLGQRMTITPEKMNRLGQRMTITPERMNRLGQRMTITPEKLNRLGQRMTITPGITAHDHHSRYHSA